VNESSKLFLVILNLFIFEIFVSEGKTNINSSMWYRLCRLLQICRLQALNRVEDAMKGLDHMINRDPTNSAAYKRKIAILKGQGKNVEAIKELTEYLNK